MCTGVFVVQGGSVVFHFSEPSQGPFVVESWQVRLVPWTEEDPAADGFRAQLQAGVPDLCSVHSKPKATSEYLPKFLVN